MNTRYQTVLIGENCAHLSWVVVCLGVVDLGNLQAVQVTLFPSAYILNAEQQHAQIQMSLSERINSSFERDIVYSSVSAPALTLATTQRTFRQFSDISPISSARALPELLRDGRERVLEVASRLCQAARDSAEVYLLEALCSLS